MEETKSIEEKIIDEKKLTANRKILGWIGDGFFGILVAILGLIIVCNVALIIQESLHPEKPASFFGLIPVIVESGSMSGSAKGHVEIGDLLLARKTDVKTLTEGNVILYQDGDITVCHRIVAVGFYEDGSRYFIMKGDANNIEDANPVPEEQVSGIVRHRIPGVGYFLNFMQSPLGMLISIALPLIILAAWEFLRGRGDAGTNLLQDKEYDNKQEASHIKDQDDNSKETIEKVEG